MGEYGKEPDIGRLKRELASGKLRPLYILSGSEDFLQEEAVQGICRLAGADSMDISRVDGSETPLGHVLDMVDTVSLFGESRFVIVNDAPYFAKGNSDKNDLGRLLSFLERQDGSSCLIICAREFARTTKAARELTADGTVFIFEPLKAAALDAWLRERLNLYGKRATRPVLELLIERVGRDLRRLASELDKLTTYLGDKDELDENSVMLATSRSIQGDIFALTEAAVYGRTSKALFLLKDLLASGEPPLRILAMLVRQFRLLGLAYELLENGCSPDDFSSRLGLHPYAAEKLAAQAAQASEANLYRAVELLLQTDLDIKRGKIDQVLALETLVVALGEKSA